MTRESRHLKISQLSEPIDEQKLKEYFKSYGRVQNLELLKDEVGSVVVSFMDMRTASKAMGVDHAVAGHHVRASYYEPSSAGLLPNTVIQIPNSDESLLHHGRPSRSSSMAVGGGGGSNNNNAISSQQQSQESRRNSGGHGVPNKPYGRSANASSGGWTTGMGGGGPSSSWQESAGHDTGVGGSNGIDTNSQQPRRPLSSGSPASRLGGGGGRYSNDRHQSSGGLRDGDDEGGGGGARGSSGDSGRSQKEQKTIVVRNLPRFVTDSSIKDGLFSTYKKHARVVSIKVIGSGSDRYALVTFRRASASKAITATNGEMFFGSKIIVDMAPYGLDGHENERRPLEKDIDQYHSTSSRTLYVGNLENRITPEQLKQIFADFGDVLDVDIRNRETPAPFAFVQFADIISVVKAIHAMEQDGYIGNNKIKVGFGKPLPSPMVWLDELPSHVTEEYLNQEMDFYGQITDVLVDSTIGQALITYESIEAAQAAVIDMKGRTIDGRKVQIDFCSQELHDLFVDRMNGGDSGVFGGLPGVGNDPLSNTPAERNSGDDCPQSPATTPGDTPQSPDKRMEGNLENENHQSHGDNSNRMSTPVNVGGGNEASGDVGTGGLNTPTLLDDVPEFEPDQPKELAEDPSDFFGGGTSPGGGHSGGLDLMGAAAIAADINANDNDDAQNAFFADFDDDDDADQAPSQVRSDVSVDLLDGKDLVSEDLNDDHDGAENSTDEDDEDANVEDADASIIDSPTQRVETKGESKVASGDVSSISGSDIAKERWSEDGDINACGDEAKKTRTPKRHDNTKDDGYDAELEKELRAFQRDLRVDLPGDDKRSKARNLESGELSIPKAKNTDKNEAAGYAENAIDDVDDSEGSEDDRSPEPDNAADYFQEFSIPLERIDEDENAMNEFFDAFDSDDEADQSDDANKADDQKQPVKRKPVLKPQPDDKNQHVDNSISIDEDEEEETVPKTKEQLQREAALRTNFGYIPSDEPSKKRTHDGSKSRLRKRSGKRILSDTEDDDNQSTNSDAALALSSSDDDDQRFVKTRRLVSVKQDLSFSQTSSSRSKGNGRRNIRAINDGSWATREAEKTERKRRQRLERIKKERQRLNASQGDAGTSADAGPVVLLDPLAEPPVKIHPRLASQLKKHQIAGVEFMFQATIESVKTFKKGEQPGGCILAHCMGLGKTFQVIAYLHSVMTYSEFNLRTAMVIVPVNVATNWDDEFRKWLGADPRILETIEVFVLTDVKSLRARIQRLQSWQADGGVLIIGYDIFRLLASEDKPVSPQDEPKKRKREKKSISDEDRKALRHCLLDPGADIVICDEGHKLKNDKAGVSDAVKKIKTKRRICLTGTPLQNNLSEYHCMVDFVKPMLLGTKAEFRNRFENPIKNGTFGDSKEDDVRRMKRQAHVLHRVLKGCVHRLDYSVLTPDIPPRHEYILFCRLSEMQVELYQTYLQNVVGGVDVDDSKSLGKRLLGDFQVLQRICAHPLMLKLHQDSNKKKSQTDGNGEPDESMDVDPGDDELPGPSHGGRRSCDKDTPTPAALSAWWKNAIAEEEAAALDMSGKFELLMEIIWRCEIRGEKLLVFSQSLLTLDLIEMFLENFDDFIDKYHNESESDKAHRMWRRKERWQWRPDKDYMRLDGSCATKKRQESINMFNTDPRCRLFLISTKAGSMGTNLVGASRVVIFDASWNPSDDAQAIFRVYRYGQTKEVFIYRFVSTGTMENVIYDRQVNKQSLALRVVDEHQIARHFSSDDLKKLYSFDTQSGNKEVPVLPKEDELLCDLLLDAKHWLDKYHEHSSLLCNVEEDELTEEEKLSAWDDYTKGFDGRQQWATGEFKKLELLKDEAGSVVVSFMDMRTASKALGVDHAVAGHPVRASYYEPSSARLLSNTVIQIHDSEESLLHHGRPSQSSSISVGGGGVSNDNNNAISSQQQSQESRRPRRLRSDHCDEWENVTREYIIVEIAPELNDVTNSRILHRVKITRVASTMADRRMWLKNFAKEPEGPQHFAVEILVFDKTPASP